MPTLSFLFWGWLWCLVMHSRPVIMRTLYLDGCQLRGTTAELPSEPYLSALMQSSSWLKTCLGGLTWCTDSTEQIFSLSLGNVNYKMQVCLSVYYSLHESQMCQGQGAKWLNPSGAIRYDLNFWEYPVGPSHLAQKCLRKLLVTRHTFFFLFDVFCNHVWPLCLLCSSDWHSNCDTPASAFQ